MWGGGVSSRWGGRHGWANVYAYEDPPELTWPTSVAVYDRMRRSSGQVSAILRSVALPIISARWELDPAGARDEVVASVAEDMGLPIMGVGELDRAGERSRFSWTEHLRQALTYLTYGHSVFELVAANIDGKLRLRKIAARPATTIAAWNVADDGGLISVDQHSRGGGVVTIPSSRLVVYSHDMSPGEWIGRSLLRPSYGVWTLKERALRVWAMVIERNGLGIPRATASPDATKDQIAALDQMAQAWRAGENSAATIPHGSAVDLVGVTGTLPDIEAHIRYMDIAIAKSVLAQAMELGTCVDTDTEMLTRRGWLRHDEITTDDECLGISAEDGLARWQPVLAVNRFPAMPRRMVRMVGDSHDSLVTTNHRWLVEHRPAPSARWGRPAGRRFVVSAGFEWRDHVPCAAPVVNLPTEPKYADALVQAVGWYVTEGSLCKGAISISQSLSANPDHCVTIRSILSALYGPPRAHVDTGQQPHLLAELRRRVDLNRSRDGSTLRRSGGMDDHFDRGRLASELIDGGMSQTEVAKAVGVQQGTLSRWVGYYRDYAGSAHRPMFKDVRREPARSDRQSSAGRCQPGLPQWRESTRTRKTAGGASCQESCWHLNQAASAPILLAAPGPEKALDPGFVSSLTMGQLHLLWNSIIDGDGWRSCGREAIHQRSKARIDSMQMVATLCGIRTSLHSHDQPAYWSDSLGREIPAGTEWGFGLHSRDSFHPRRMAARGQRFSVRDEVHGGAVWCPTTQSETWLARRNGHVFYTGNSTEGSRALSISWIDFFKLSLQAMMRELADVANNHIVADIVEWNWGPDEPAPRIRPAETSLEQAVAPADLARLIQVGAIAVDDTTERWLRTRSQMPERDGSEPRSLPVGAGAQSMPPTPEA